MEHDRRTTAMAVFSELLESCQRDDRMSKAASADVIEAASVLADEAYTQGIADERDRCLGLTRNLIWGRIDGARDLFRAIEDGLDPEADE